MDSKRVLVVDDEEHIIEVLEGFFELSGYQPLVARDGEEALKVAREEKPDLILLDVMLAKLNGYQVCRALKNDESVKDIPVIMLTAKIQESEKHWARECGCDGYIAKPFELEDLRKVIEAQLEKRKTKA